MIKIIIELFLVAGLLANAHSAECTLYEQSHPAFLLDGAHLSTGKCQTCSTCHRAGIFMGTPKSCVACHNGDPARVTVGRSAAHIPTGLIECNMCHRTTSFTVNTGMDHTTVTNQRCDSCHNGSYTAYGAKTKSATHISTMADCTTCHAVTSWGVDHTKLHSGITTGCVNCHDGRIAIGKSSYTAGHPVTSDQCETCHSVNAGFKCASLLDKIQAYLAQVSTRLERVVYSILA